MHNNEETRIKKWMKYREEILENKNIRESLIVSNKEFNSQYKKLSTIFHNVNFLENENDDFLSRIDSIDLNTQEKMEEVENFLEIIHSNESYKRKKSIHEIKYNSNKYNKFIKKYFINEFNKNIEEIDKIKVTKIDLGK